MKRERKEIERERERERQEKRKDETTKHFNTHTLEWPFRSEGMM